jgi:predicted amidophosphoribosyltransferase
MSKNKMLATMLLFSAFAETNNKCMDKDKKLDKKQINVCPICQKKYNHSGKFCSAECNKINKKRSLQ